MNAASFSPRNVLQLVGSDSSAPALADDDGGDLLAEAVVRQAEDRDVGDVRVLEDRRLDLGAVDVLAAAQHHVLDPVDDVDEAVLVDAARVAGVEPAVR